jgi:acetyl-CoA synthetase (ADP-forming)
LAISDHKNADAMSMRRHMTEGQAKELLARYGIHTPRRCFATNADQALAAFRELQSPLVVKLVSRVLHKSDVGGVQLNVASTDTLLEAIHAIDRAAEQHSIAVEGYLVEEMAAHGVEVLVGGMVDAVFGPALLVGLGGIFTEVLDDVALRICPISKKDALEMIGELRAAPLLLGARGRPRVDIDALAAVLMALGGPEGFLMQHSGLVTEVDLNPVIVSTSGAIAVDARVVLREDAGDAG